MADKITYFPPINNIRMAPYNKALPTAFHYHQFDKAPFIQQQQRFNLQQYYCQKVQFTDPQNFWFYSNGVVTVTLCSVDPYTGKLTTVATLSHIDFAPPITSYQFPYTADNGQTYDLDVHGYLHKFISGTHPEGYYCFFVHVHYQDPDNEEDVADEDYISEVMWLRASHPKTVRIRYRNSYDAFNIMWERFGMSFFLRFDSNWMTMEPASDDVVFSDQDDNVRRLYGNPYRVFKLNIGGNYG
ncbi:hypothetical protein JST56_07285, partial [Candidatus Dependentiae bacterium]|nr:hypothetical protein [Candidatus Dependentiae bacterium]